jgi:hypothetical protein
MMRINYSLLAIAMGCSILALHGMIKDQRPFYEILGEEKGRKAIERLEKEEKERQTKWEKDPMESDYTGLTAKIKKQVVEEQEWVEKEAQMNAEIEAFKKSLSLSEDDSQKLRAIKQYVEKAKRDFYSQRAAEIDKRVNAAIAQGQHQEKMTRVVLDEKAKERIIKEEAEEWAQQFAKLDKDIPLIRNNPLASVWGGINYAMSLPEMEQVVKNKFKDMRAQGKIISPAQFEKIKDEYYTERPSTDLCRIWGALYLKDKIRELSFKKPFFSSLDVPDYIIVADNPNDIRVRLTFDSPLWPVVKSLESATCYFKKIDGSGVADEYRNLRELRYVDFSDNNNILRDFKTGKNFFIDTEFKSFQGAGGIEEDLDSELQKILEYAREKFKYQYQKNIIYDMYTFPLGRLDQ